jgi:hypothetical protein
MTMEIQINRQMLRHHVAQAIFCPQCQNVLDMGHAVSIDLMKGDDLRRAWILCEKCWDARKLALHDAALQSGHSLAVHDGRILFGKKTR